MLWSQSVPVECVRFSTALPTLLQRVMSGIHFTCHNFGFQVHLPPLCIAPSN